MKPSEGRRRIVIEEIQPQVDAGRYPAKRVTGDLVEVTAAIFGDGHDHVAARLLYRHESQKKWASVSFRELTNDLWTASFPVDKLGMWRFTIKAWVDHFDTWVHDLGKRLAAQPDPKEPTQQATPQDIPLALRIGSDHVEAAGSRAKGDDASLLRGCCGKAASTGGSKSPFYESPITPELEELAAQYPDLSFATKYPVELPALGRSRTCTFFELV